MRIKNYVKRIGEGKDSPAITAALDQCEAELSAVEQLLAAADIAMDLTTITRPTAAEIQGVWSEFLDLWEEATATERKTMMSRFVRRVDVTDKNKASLQIVGAIAGTLDVKFATKSRMGAAINPGANNFAGVGFEAMVQRPKFQRQSNVAAAI